MGLWCYVDTILVTETPPTPTITVGSAITNLNYASGSGPSTSQTTTVSGSNLEANISLTAPTNFEISTNNSSFSDSVTLSIDSILKLSMQDLNQVCQIIAILEI